MATPPVSDAELRACLDRFPGGEPITLYHADATGNLLRAVEANGGLISVSQNGGSSTVRIIRDPFPMLP